MKGAKCFTAKCPISRRPYPPGVHGPAQTRAKITGFGTQLREKQKAKRVYGLMERQFSNYVAEATGTAGNTAERLQQLLEMRLDNVIYRLGLATSRSEARQLVGHGKVKINGKKLDIASYQVEVNDEVTLTADAVDALGKRTEQIAKQDRPAWLHLEMKGLVGKVLSKPGVKDVEQLYDVTPIIEYYSR